MKAVFLVVLSSCVFKGSSWKYLLQFASILKLSLSHPPPLVGGKEPRNRRVRAAAAMLLEEPQPPSCSRHRQAHLSASAPETPGHPSKGPRGWGLQHHSLRLLGLHLCPNPLSFPRPVLSSRLTGWLHPRPPKVREGSPGTMYELGYQVSLWIQVWSRSPQVWLCWFARTAVTRCCDRLTIWLDLS